MEAFWVSPTGKPLFGEQQVGQASRLSSLHFARPMLCLGGAASEATPAGEIFPPQLLAWDTQKAL